MTEPTGHDEHDPGASAISRRAFIGGSLAVPLGAYLPDMLSRPEHAALGRTRPLSAIEQVACSLPREVLRRVQRGWHPTRAGQLVIVPKGFNYVSGGISHSVPWDYIQRVPMFWYGPGFIERGRKPSGFVSAADIAPTIARLIGFDAFLDRPRVEGDPMEAALTPAVRQGRKRPRLVVVLVWDGAGRYVLNLWPKAWPYLSSLIPRGTSYPNAFVGSSPSSTAPVHATMGSATFPRTHGIMDNYNLWPDGSIRDPWAQGPTQMLVPTLADLYGEARGHRPKIVIFATLSWHLGMMGRGKFHDPKSTQIAVLKDLTKYPPAWGLGDADADYYRLPADLKRKLNEGSPPISQFYEEADRLDGTNDGTWRGHDIDSREYQGGFHTPARIGFQTAAIRRLISHLGLGHNDPGITDLLFLNYKLIDETGHRFSASSREMRDSLVIQDRYLKVLVRMLNEQVGRGEWVMLLTADHGHTAHTSVSGGLPIETGVVGHELRSRFDPDGNGRTAFRLMRPTWIYLDEGELRSQGHSVADVAAFIRQMTKSDVSSDRGGGERAWASAFSGEVLPGLDCG